MTNRIQQTYARTTSTGAGGAQPFLLETKGMTDHATLNADILAAAKEGMRSALERQDWRGVNVLEKRVHSQERQGQEACKLLWQRAMDLAFSLGDAEGAAGRELADAPALLQLVPVLNGGLEKRSEFPQEVE